MNSSETDSSESHGQTGEAPKLPVKWPQEIARFVNGRLRRSMLKPLSVGLTVLAAFVVRILDPGFGLILLFLPMSYLCEGLRRAFAAPVDQFGGL